MEWSKVYNVLILTVSDCHCRVHLHDFHSATYAQDQLHYILLEEDSSSNCLY